MTRCLALSLINVELFVDDGGRLARRLDQPWAWVSIIVVSVFLFLAQTRTTGNIYRFGVILCGTEAFDSCNLLLIVAFCMQ